MYVSGKSQSARQGDPVINALLDELVAITGIDPSWMMPEHLLGKDLEMSETAISELAARLATRFAPGGRFDSSRWSNSSLRQIVDFVREMSQSSGWRSASSF